MPAPCPALASLTSRPPCEHTDPVRRPDITTLPRSDVSDIGHPSLIRGIDSEGPVEMIGGNDRWSAFDCARGFIASERLDFIGAHQCRDTVLAATFSSQQTPSVRHTHLDWPHRSRGSALTDDHSLFHDPKQACVAINRTRHEQLSTPDTA